MGVALVMKRVVSYCQKEQGNAVSNLTSYTLLTRQSASVLKSGSAMHVAKLKKEDWPIVLQ